MPEGFTLHLLAVFGYVAEADAGNFPYVLGGELKCVGGPAEKKEKKKKQFLVCTVSSNIHLSA